MVHKYVRIRNAAKHVPAVEELLPRLSDHRRILVLHDKLKELQSYPVMEEYLKPTAKIVHSPTFEAAVIKVTSSLPVTNAEAKTLEPFRRPEGSGQSEDEPAADFASEILRRVKKPRQSQRHAVDYVPLLGAIPPIGNRCERLFSECKYVLESHRASMRSANFERLIFLKANRDLLNASTLVP
ncbi:hypothetical protein JG688_00011224 [Phytophthora aleatoria]|uniref:HAT C-terminal dimerisation domain-containing protein n=1 Tax=Phytophthora aleatoria TaxID=2496075 RepID=A0A8J5M5E1_9STRA|nr:hypothetical protein JG688_00011224 [Phytophthora aleatoria]